MTFCGSLPSNSGLLSAVSDLRASSNASSVTISWTAPFSLNMTDDDPDIWYSVLIYNVTDENNPTAILCTDCINITETHYTFTPDYLSPCHVYNFSVIPVNGAGQGESSVNVTYRRYLTIEQLSQSALNQVNIKNASIIQDGSVVTVTCTPDKASSSCVLVYRAHSNTTLSCKETFPTTIILDPNFNYAFAIFRKPNDHDIDERPFISKFVPGEEDETTTSSQPSPEPPVTGKLIVIIHLQRCNTLVFY